MLAYNSCAKTNLDGEFTSASVFTLTTIACIGCHWQYVTSCTVFVCVNLSCKTSHIQTVWKWFYL